MTTEYNDFISFLEKYRDELIVALSAEREKRQALICGDIERLETMLITQQAETMKLKSFEDKRSEMQAKLGFGNFKAKEIIAAVDDVEISRILGRLFLEIVDSINKIKQQNKVAIELANTNIKILNNMMKAPRSSFQKFEFSSEREGDKRLSGKPMFEKTV
jgi:FlgN protein.